LQEHIMSLAVKDDQVSVRLPSQLKEQMETYAQLIGRTKSHVATEALSDYLAWRTPQIQDLKLAVAAADAGDFASAAEVQALAARYAPTRPKRVVAVKTGKPARRP
jgi:predicted transcriptional regulator